MGTRSGSSEKTDPCTLLLSSDPVDTATTHGACLVVLRGPRLGARFELAELPVVIGRGSDADFRIPSRSVSRSHCRILLEGDALWVEDLRSTNQTLVNGLAVDRQCLDDGDQLRIGDAVLKFLAAGNTESSFLAKMREHLIRDELTGLYNRRHLMARLNDAIELRDDPGQGGTLSLAILDVDRFKEINDLVGHMAGDEVLRQLADVLSSELRSDDVLARIGGEEFAILMPGQSLRDAHRLCERLRAAVEAHVFDLQGGERALPVTVSLGVAEWTESMREVNDLLKLADDLLYRSKSAGRNRVSCGAA
jgi:diguanylate cyclase (GGDEF)-like protein